MKKTIYIIIIVIALGGALVMGYMAMTASPATEEGGMVTNTGGPAVYNILPEGKSLEFGSIKNFNKDNRLFPYPTVNTSEIGKDLSSIIE